MGSKPTEAKELPSEETPPQAVPTAQPKQEIPAENVIETAPPTPPAPAAAPTPPTADNSESPPPHAGPVTDDFFSSSAAEINSQETPSPQPSGTTAIAEAPVQPKKAEPIDFDALIAAAPDISPEPEPAPLPAQPSTPAPEPEEIVKEEEQPPQLDEKFYEDPLIIEALEMFKGRLIKS